MFCFNHTCYCVGMASVMSASHYVTSASHYQSRSSMYIRDLIPQKSTDLPEAVLIDCCTWYGPSLFTKVASIQKVNHFNLPIALWNNCGGSKPWEILSSLILGHSQAHHPLWIHLYRGTILVAPHSCHPVQFYNIITAKSTQSCLILEHDTL